MPKLPFAIGGETNADGSANVYFLTMVDPKDPARDLGFVKVGLTKGDVHTRIAQLQTGNPFRLQCRGRLSSPFAGLVENYLHRTHASKGKQLEWLRCSNEDIDEMLAAAEREAERIGTIARAVTHWSAIKSDGKPPRPSTVREQRLRNDAKPLRDALRLAEARLENAKLGIQIEAGRVRQIAGVVNTRFFERHRRFDPSKAAEKFKPLAVKHETSIETSFRWLGPLYGDLSLKSSTKAELARKARLEQGKRELYAAMVDNWDDLPDSGKLTDTLAHLHEEYLTLTEKVARLRLDEYDIKAQLIESIETSEAIKDVCSYKRSPALDAGMFCEALQQMYGEQKLSKCPDLQDCCIEIPAHIRRPIIRSRSYL